MRKLTNLQVAVLAALERIGQPTLDELKGQLPGLTPSEIGRVVEALVRRGLVDEIGRPARLVAVPRSLRAGRQGSMPPGE